MRHWMKSIGFLAIGVFLMIPVFPGNFALLWGSDADVIIEDDTSLSGDLRLKNGSVTGHFKQWPISKVLDILLGQISIEYSAREELLDHPVSGNFDQTPFNDALHKVLDPFNYLVIQDAQENIKRLSIMGLKNGRPENLPDPQESMTARVSPGPVNKDLHAFEKNLKEALTNNLPKKNVPNSEINNPDANHHPQSSESGLLPLDEVELTEEQRQGFDMAGQKIIQLPEEERKRLLPSQQSTEQKQIQDPAQQPNKPSWEGKDWFSSPQKPLLDGILESFRKTD